MSDTAGLIPVFYLKAVQHKAESLEKGRPIFKEQERIEILFVGDNSQKIDRKASDEDRERFREQYEKFKRKQEQVSDGTPLEQWPPLNISQIAELKHYNVFTVEQLASLTDTQMQKIPGVRDLSKRAQHFLESLSPDAATADKVATLESENEKLQKTLQETLARLDKLEEKKPKKTKAA